MPTTRLRLIAAAAAAAGLALAPASALAASLNGITPSSPKSGASAPAGKTITFTGRVKGAGRVYVHVCRSAKKRKSDGTICFTQLIAQAKKRGTTFTLRQKPYAFDAYWLNRPGTYYWQAHRIACEGDDTDDCRQEGPIVRFRVR